MLVTPPPRSLFIRMQAFSWVCVWMWLSLVFVSVVCPCILACVSFFVFSLWRLLEDVHFKTDSYNYRDAVLHVQQLGHRRILQRMGISMHKTVWLRCICCCMFLKTLSLQSFARLWSLSAWHSLSHHCLVVTRCARLQLFVIMLENQAIPFLIKNVTSPGSFCLLCHIFIVKLKS